MPSENGDKILDARRHEDSGMGIEKYSIMESIEYRDEDSRVHKIKHSDMVVSDSDLERIFKNQPIEKIPPIRVVNLNGINVSHTQQFNGDPAAFREASKPATTSTPAGTTSNASSGFGSPNEKNTKDCPTCGKKKSQEPAGAFSTPEPPK